MGFGLRGTNQRVRPSPDRLSKGIHVLGDTPEIVDNFVKVLGIVRDCIVELRHNRISFGQRRTQILHGLANIRTIILNHRIDAIQSFVGFQGRLVEIVYERSELGAGGVNVVQRGMNQRPIFLKHAAEVGETFADVLAVSIVQEIVDTTNGFLQFNHAGVQMNYQIVGGGSQSVYFVSDIGKTDELF